MANKANVIELKEAIAPEATSPEVEKKPMSHDYILPATDKVGAIAVTDEFVFMSDYEMSCAGDELKNLFGSTRALFLPVYCNIGSKVVLPHGTRFKVTKWEKVAGDLPYQYSFSVKLPEGASPELNSVGSGSLETKSDVTVGELEKMLKDSFYIRSQR